MITVLSLFQTTGILYKPTLLTLPNTGRYRIRQFPSLARISDRSISLYDYVLWAYPERTRIFVTLSGSYAASSTRIYVKTNCQHIPVTQGTLQGVVTFGLYQYAVERYSWASSASIAPATEQQLLFKTPRITCTQLRSSLAPDFPSNESSKFEKYSFR